MDFRVQSVLISHITLFGFGKMPPTLYSREVENEKGKYCFIISINSIYY